MMKNKLLLPEVKEFQSACAQYCRSESACYDLLIAGKKLVSAKDARIKVLETTIAELEKKNKILLNLANEKNGEDGRFESQLKQLKQLEAQLAHHSKPFKRPENLLSPGWYAQYKIRIETCAEHVQTHLKDYENLLAQCGEPVAWLFYSENEYYGYLTDDLEDAQLVDDMTNMPDAELTPLYTHPAPEPLPEQGNYAEVMRDAARYRWLRDAPATHSDGKGVRQWLWQRPGGAATMDAAIDDAIAKGGV